ncbi:MAG: malonyl-ACP O-methyltransferase BioC [Bacteroidales bacterium]
MDKSLLTERFRKAANSYETEAIAQRHIAKNLWEITAPVISGTACESILEIGCGTGFLTRNYQHLIGKEIILNDIYDVSENFCPSEKISYRIGDAEQIEWNRTFDLILSASSIQWFQHLDRFFENYSNILNKNGVIALSTFGPENFKEIRQAGGRSLDYLNKEELISKFTKHFDLICVKEEKITIQFDTVREVLRHIKSTGVMGGLGTGAPLRELLLFEKKYNDQNCASDYAPLTYHPIYLTGRKR